MKIWWCQEHECSGEDVSCVYAHWNDAEGHVGNMPPCRMVAMRLISDQLYALCQKCHTRRRLRKDGTFQAHHYSKGWPVSCEGSGETP